MTILGRFARRPSALLGGLCLLLLVLAILLAPFVLRHTPWATDGLPLLWPGEDPAYPLGTDSLGRDLAAGILSGAWVSLLTGIASATMALIIGAGIGMIAGYYEGWPDTVLTGLTDTVQTIPPFVLAVVIVSVLQPTLWTVILSVGIISWPPTARLMRAQVRQIRDTDYLRAARVLGMGDMRLIATQILPNALPPVIVLATLGISNAILTASALAFLGLGDPGVMDWGTIIGEGREQLLDAWYICALPGAAIMISVLAFNLLGEALNDVLNPQLGDQ